MFPGCYLGGVGGRPGGFVVHFIFLGRDVDVIVTYCYLFVTQTRLRVIANYLKKTKKTLEVGRQCRCCWFVAKPGTELGAIGFASSFKHKTSVFEVCSGTEKMDGWMDGKKEILKVIECEGQAESPRIYYIAM